MAKLAALGRSVLRFPNGSMRLVMVTVIGAVLGFFIGISFPSVSITKLHFPASFVSYIEDKNSGLTTQAILNHAWTSARNARGNSTEPTSNSTLKIYVPTNPKGAEGLAPGIVVSESDFHLRRLWGDPSEDLPFKPKYLVTFTVGVAQKENINRAVKKFSDNFAILLFHYDGRAEESAPHTASSAEPPAPADSSSSPRALARSPSSPVSSLHPPHLLPRDRAPACQRADRHRRTTGGRGRVGIMDKYEPVRDIGSGNFGVARLMRNRETRGLVAVKLIERGHRIDENVYREIVNHRSLRHPNIIQFIEVILTPTHLAIVMEYAAGGELFDRIVDRGRFSEDEARYFFQQLICGVSYCHHMQICHRDLKLENVLLDGSPAPRLKICDFGYSKSSVLHSRPKSAVGTPAYIAPEVLSRREYDGKLADVWSCGVTLFVMLVGAYPFEDQDDPKNIRKTIQRIAAIQYTIPDNIHISDDCRQLISRIFVSNPLRRITMREIKNHPWFLKNLPRELTEAVQLSYFRRDNSVSAFSEQTTEEIMRIVKEARTLPKSLRSGYGYSEECSDVEENEEESEPKEVEEEDECDKRVREVRESGELDMTSLHI